MLWRMAADRHVQRIGTMRPARAFFGDPSTGVQSFSHQSFAPPPIARTGSENRRKPASLISANSREDCRRRGRSRQLQVRCALQKARSRYSPDRALCYMSVSNQKGLCARPRENAVGLFLLSEAPGLSAAPASGRPAQGAPPDAPGWPECASGRPAPARLPHGPAAGPGRCDHAGRRRRTSGQQPAQWPPECPPPGSGPCLPLGSL